MQTICLYRPLSDGMTNAELALLLREDIQLKKAEYLKKVNALYFAQDFCLRQEFPELHKRRIAILASSWFVSGVIFLYGCYKAAKLCPQENSMIEIAALCFGVWLMIYFTDRTAQYLDNYLLLKQYDFYTEQFSHYVHTITGKIQQLIIFPEKPIDIIQLSKDFSSLKLSSETRSRLSLQLRKGQLEQLGLRVSALKPEGYPKTVLSNKLGSFEKDPVIALSISAGNYVPKARRWIQRKTFENYPFFKDLFTKCTDKGSTNEISLKLCNQKQLEAFGYIIQYIQNNHVEVPVAMIPLIQKLSLLFGIQDCYKDCKEYLAQTLHHLRYH